jgi:uncharacterized phage protein gp47/JayE
MSIELLTLDEMTDLLVAFAKNLLPEDDYSKGSDNWLRLRTVAGGDTDLNAMLQAVERDMWADTASEEALENKHGVKLQLPRKGAIKASGALAGLIVGDVAETWLATDALVHVNGQRYFPTSGGTIGASGQELVGIIAETGGLAGNLGAGEVLSWESPPGGGGIETEVELQVALTLGADKEPLGAYRIRILNREAFPSMGGNANDWKDWIEESSDDIATGYVWPGRNGKGSVDIAGLKSGTGATRLLDGSERTALQAAVQLLRPVAGTPRTLEVTTETQGVEITLVPESELEFAKDWNDSTPPVVLTWVLATRLLTFDAARPASMAVGDRIVVENTSGVDLVIESLSGTDAVILVGAKGQTPAALDEVYSGGPIVTSVRAAVLALFNALGPRVDEFGDSKWVSTLFLSHLFETAQTTAGVLDSTIVSPVADAKPTATSYPVDDSTINLLIAGDVLVRYA